jgi:large-conductance mechanosensitive channel
MIIIRFVLISFIVYLIVRSFTRYWKEEVSSGANPQADAGIREDKKKVSKKVGEYIDYEELGK